MKPRGFELTEGVPLAPLTTFGVGGPARYFATARTEPEAMAAVAWACERRLPILPLGGGSNLLVADRGFDGLVLRVGLRGVCFTDHGECTVVEAGAGEVWDEVVAAATLRDLVGVEALSGIPGDVGATPIQNVGAYGQEVGDTLASLRALECETGRLVEMDREALGLGYRDSIFKRGARDRFVVTTVRFRLHRGRPPSIRYGELSAKLSEGQGPGAAPPTAAGVRAAVLELRRAKSMLFDPSDPNGRSAGSFFMNPTVTEGAAKAIEERLAQGGGQAQRMPAFPGPQGVKLSAAWLIERAGFPRGTGLGAVGLSTKHALCVVNRGRASATEIIAFARQIRRGVSDRFGVTLRPEPVFVGFAQGELEGLAAGSPE